MLGKTIVFVASAALAEELCDERRFRKYVGGPIVEIRYAVNDSLFTAYVSVLLRYRANATRSREPLFCTAVQLMI